MNKVKLKPGDYVSTEDMTEEQYHAVCKAFMEAGAKGDLPYEFTHERRFVGWDTRDDRFYASLCDEEFLSKWAFTNKLTINQILGKEQDMNTKDMTLQEAYKVMQANCGIEVGDTVRVLRKAKQFENGWDATWNPCMDEYIGEVGKVINKCDNSGFAVHFRKDFWSLPFFVLELVKKAPKLPSPIRISSQYKAEFNEDGSIAVGSYNLSFDTIEQIYLTAKELKEKYDE